MKKISIRKKVLTLLLSSHILLTGCSIPGKVTSKKMNNSLDSSYSQSSIDENNTYQSIFEDSSNTESPLDKKENIESKEESIECVESSVEQESAEESKEEIEENSVEEISELESSIEQESAEESKEEIEENSVEEISESESSIEQESAEESKEEIEENSVEEISKLESSIEQESSKEIIENSNEENSVEEIGELESSIEEDSKIEESSEEEYDDSNEVYTDDESYIRAKTYVNVRTKPSTSSKILDLLYQGDELKKLGFVDEYYIVDYKGKKAYVAMDYTEEIQKSLINVDLKISDICYFPYGSSLFSDKELTNKIKDIPSLESGEIYYQDGNAYYVETDGDKGYVSVYSASIISQPAVIVDESDQTLKLYKDNTKKMEFPVVTGNYPNYASTKGLFNIYSKSYNARLVGPTWDVYVNVFMGYTVYGEGIHDAVWRPYYEFGGTTYQGNGSHGCVNCMYDDVMALAEEVEVGNKVLVKR